MGAFIGRVVRQCLARPGPGGFWAALLMALLVAAALRVDRLTGEPQLTLPLLLSGLLSAGLCGLGIPWIRRLRMGQVIREEGPGHHQAKTGTPTMGGLLLVPCGVLVGGLVDVGDSRLLLLAATTLGFMAIGGLDDWQSLRKQHNSGLTVRGKLALQGLLALAFLGIGMGQGWIPATASLPFGMAIPLGPLIWPLGLFVFLAESNATNLNDGLDGLAAGCGAILLLGLAMQLMMRGDSGDPALAGFAAAMGGAWLGFLVHNHRPARIFMGDTGSLALGAALAGVALLSDSLWALVLMGVVLIAESASVVLQVFWFKFTRRWWGKPQRLLRMAPLHHHFELGGHPELTVVVGFWAASGVAVLLGLAVLAG